MLDHARESLHRAAQANALAASRDTGCRATFPLSGGLTGWQIKRVKLYIDAHLAARIRCHELADLVKLSTGHFHRGFVVSFGQTPHNYILRCRMENAKLLMRTTSLPLGQIATRCGMADQPHFCRTFLRIVGDRPLLWRLSRTGDASNALQADAITSSQVTICRVTPAPSGGLAAWQVDRVKLHIDAHVAESIRCRKLAELVCLSTRHFRRGFAISFGRTPRNYILNRRMEHAKLLMRTTSLPLVQIAVECGMTDQSHFCRSFLRVCGDRPSVWRRNDGALRAGMNSSYVATTVRSGMTGSQPAPAFIL